MEARILHSDLKELNKELDKVLLLFRSLIVEDGTLQLVYCRYLLYLQDLEMLIVMDTLLRYNLIIVKLNYSITLVSLLPRARLSRGSNLL